MAMVVTVIITGGVMAVIIAMVITVIIMAPGKGSGKNPKKSSPRKKKGIPSGLLTQKKAQIGVIGAPLDASPAQKG